MRALQYRQQSHQFDIGFLGHMESADQYAGIDAGNGTLMRHNLRPTNSPCTLPRSVLRGTAEARLVANTGAAPRFAAADPGAIAGAILIAAIAVGTDADLHRAARAIVESVRFLPCPHAPRTALDKAARDWHKGEATAPRARAQWKARDSAKNVPGPSSIRRLRRGYAGDRRSTAASDQS